MTRQTFYYHFKNIYELIDWIFTNEAAKALDSARNVYRSWQESFRQIFEYLLANKTLIYRTYHSNAREHLRKYLNGEAFDCLVVVFDEWASDFNLLVPESEKKFFATFYMHAYVGILLDWIDTGMMDKPSSIIDKLSKIIWNSPNEWMRK